MYWDVKYLCILKLHIYMYPGKFDIDLCCLNLQTRDATCVLARVL